MNPIDRIRALLPEGMEVRECFGKHIVGPATDMLDAFNLAQRLHVAFTDAMEETTITQRLREYEVRFGDESVSVMHHGARDALFRSAQMNAAEAVKEGAS